MPNYLEKKVTIESADASNAGIPTPNAITLCPNDNVVSILVNLISMS